MKKLLSLVMMLLMSVTLVAGCKDDDKKGATTLEDVNAFLNDKVNMNMDLANTVAIIPFNHVNGFGHEWKFYALVNFQYKEATYVKYQVTYLSCTCRSADVNYWQTAYIELSLPVKAQNVRLQKLSFGSDGGIYTAGFWGDSSPIHDESDPTKIVATYDEYIPTTQEKGYWTTNDEGVEGYYYPTIKNEFVEDLLIGKTGAEIAQYNKMRDMYQAGVMSEELFDSFTGASVSTNNILRILHAMFKYHEATWYSTAE